jgi:RNA polymerase sigma-70 factor (ECF subfamily)
MNVALDLEIVSSALRRIAIGDRVALRTVYRLTSAKLFGICLRILGEQGDAEDVLQEVYVAVWQKAASFDPARASPMTWLIAIARNRAIHRLRASGQNRHLEPIDTADERADADQALETVKGSGLYDCLGSLTKHERAALRAAFFDGNTYEELAKRADVPLNAIKSRIRRALIILKPCLDQ